MNVNHIKDKLRKRKISVWYKNILNERFLTYLKERDPIYVDGEGMTNNQQNKKDDASITYFPKTAYWRPLDTNAEIVYKKT